jgi:hypothetical protein
MPLFESAFVSLPTNNNLLILQYKEQLKFVTAASLLKLFAIDGGLFASAYLTHFVPRTSACSFAEFYSVDRARARARS